jgi:cell division protease FtsH
MQATKLARSMVCEWGMSDDLGTVSYDERTESGQYLGMAGYHEKNYSDETAQQIDLEVRKLIDDAHKKALTLLEENRDKVQLMADMLMEFETLDATDVKEIMAGTWDAEKKRTRVKAAEDLQMKNPPPPPPLPAQVRPLAPPPKDAPGMQPGQA